MTIEEVCRKIECAFVEEAQSDFCGLWLLAKWVREDLPSVDRETARRTTLVIIRRALENGQLVAGEFVDRNFVPWDMSPTEVLDRIDRAWSELGREPDVGDIAWFVAPAALGGA